METDKLIEAINLQTQAIRYLADVIGYKADSNNDGSVKLDAKVAVEQVYTFDQIKDALNSFAKTHGKEKTLAVVNKYAGEFDPTKINEDDYPAVMQEVA